MEKNYVDILCKKHDDFNSYEPYIDGLTKELSFMTDFIPEFFSKAGEAECIRNIYSKLKDDNICNHTIQCPDINKGSSIYLEYIAGMKKFIQDLMDIKDSEQTSSHIEDFQNKFNLAKEKDSKFVDCLYKDFSPKIEMNLKDAMQNIEYLIDFIPKIAEFKDSCCEVYKNIVGNQNYSERQHYLLHEMCRLMVCSIRNYCLVTLKNILFTFRDIQEMIAAPVKPVNEPPKFQLF